MLFKIGVLIDFEIFTGKHLCCRPGERAYFKFIGYHIMGLLEVWAYLLGHLSIDYFKR